MAGCYFLPLDDRKLLDSTARRRDKHSLAQIMSDRSEGRLQAAALSGAIMSGEGEGGAWVISAPFLRVAFRR